MSDPQALIGKVLGPYEVLREVGRGGMGIVYEARDRTLQRTVALKVLAPHFAGDPEFVKRFLREARAAAQLSHPNLVHIYSVGQHEDIYYMAMEYVRGRPLADLIRERGPLEPRLALRIARHVAEALAEAHRHDIVHRDVKPKNIMVDEEGRVKVMDFGLAKVLHGGGHLTATGAALGTPMYMSPEQCRGLQVDHRTDIYSLGVTLYEMLAGSPPFRLDTPPLGLMYQIVHAPFPPLPGLSTDTPPQLGHLLSRMVAKRPEDRHDSAKVLCHDLTACLKGLSLLEQHPLAQQPAAPSRSVRFPAGTSSQPQVVFDEKLRAEIVKPAEGPFAGASRVRQGRSGF